MNYRNYCAESASDLSARYPGLSISADRFVGAGDVAYVVLERSGYVLARREYAIGTLSADGTLSVSGELGSMYVYRSYADARRAALASAPRERD